MDTALRIKRFFQVDIQRLLLFIGLSVAFVFALQYHGLPEKGALSLWNVAKSFRIMMVGSSSTTRELKFTNMNSINATNTYEADINEEAHETGVMEPYYTSETYRDGDSLGGLAMENVSVDKIMGRGDAETSSRKPTELKENFSNNAAKEKKKKLKKLKKKLNRPSLSISQMNSLLLQNYASSHSKRPKQLTARDREILYAKLEIEKAPILRNIPELHASVYRNISMFQRSYELMEETFRVYVYRDGEKPIFHQPIMTGIYASEGWFTKIIEGNRKFTVEDPKSAHVFYIPFGSQMLRLALRYDAKHFHNSDDLANYLGKYAALIAGRYPFWNRTRGADHFVVACHDWGPKITKELENCIRALCNSDAGKEFEIGRDTSVPVTFIKSADNPLKDLGGNRHSDRSFLAFFAGSMHGYVRPLLLQHWQNKEPDMAIFGHLPRRSKGKKSYADYMESSKYCICAKGYSVHTPRVVESIMHECVPVILADNYVPPFFEVLDWETFAVFVKERDIPNLRNILLSIPEKKYLEMQQRVKIVQQHFLWHRKPVKYDIFHMILHSVWYNRVFQARSR